MVRDSNKKHHLTPGQRLRDAWQAEPLMLPGVFQPLAAKLAERAGFRAVYLSGGALSASLGMPDVGLVTLTEFVDHARAITRVTELPLVCDADTGFGEAINVERTVREFEAVGVAGVHLEDQILPKRCGHLSGKQLAHPDEMAQKIRAACQARRDPHFVIIARTDARGVSSLDDAISRANAYLQAGADVIFPEALTSEAEFRQFAEQVSAPLLANMTEFGKGPLLDRDTLAGIGYRLLLYPLTAYRAALAATRDVFVTLMRDGHQRDLLGGMLSRADLYDILDYQGFEARDRDHFGPRSEE